MSDDVDIDCGQIIVGDKPLAEMGQKIFERLLARTSELTKSE